ncbi:hypothetical protein BGM26_04750 [Bacillus sp. FJAT-29790]|uniref:hypothetical protein n=1 Tax=Bacillus sp. FJAT-29790 TaxID=1895002 RepID=UPI001C248917|nr:hypothetical protein [Bacillus sp. FJAT-29790]MBU8878295.1 hypothetical protein [Bacillus sp. FJAT-29790]
MEKTLKLILDKIDSLDQKVTSLDQKVNSLDQKVTAMDQRMTDMDERLTSEQKRQEGLLHQLINTVAATNVKVSETNDRIDVLERKMDTIIEDVKDIKDSMATKNDLEYYDQMISEHSREIYKLKNS